MYFMKSLKIKMDIFKTKQLKIGSVVIKNNVLMAPMAGISDKSFRKLCREMGCGLAYSEMVSAKSINYNNFKDLLDVSDEGRPFAVQLFGREPDTIAEAALRLDDICGGAVDIVDINMGCPAPKIVNNGEGSALMKEPLLAGEIVSTLVRAINKPVTVKIRKGFTNSRANACEIAKIAQESGASAVTVHGRTRDQFYSGEADWDAIAEVKSKLNIPVIANGDVFSAEAAVKILEHTGCDGLMVARGALGNPWIFSQILFNASPPDLEEKMALALRHTRMLTAHKGEYSAILEMRKHLSWYIKGLPKATELRVKINKASSYNEVEALLTL